MQEKEEEFENTRKNHQRQIEALQTTIENEVKAKGDAAKNRKKYESEILELEGQLEMVSRGSGDHQKVIKKLQAQIKVHNYTRIFTDMYRWIFTLWQKKGEWIKISSYF